LRRKRDKKKAFRREFSNPGKTLGGGYAASREERGKSTREKLRRKSLKEKLEGGEKCFTKRLKVLMLYHEECKKKGKKER